MIKILELKLCIISATITNDYDLNLGTLKIILKLLISLEFINSSHTILNFASVIISSCYSALKV